MSNLTTCRICGSPDVYSIVTTELITAPWANVHLAYCEKCAKKIEEYEKYLMKIEGERA